MTAFSTLAGLERTPIWPGVLGRLVTGDNLTVGVIEVEPDGVVPEHHHPQEQVGFVIEGRLRAWVGDEEADLGPGGIYHITDDVPHHFQAGPDGAVVADLFAPPRQDWAARETMPPNPPRWP